MHLLTKQGELPSNLPGFVPQQHSGEIAVTVEQPTAESDFDAASSTSVTNADNSCSTEEAVNISDSPKELPNPSNKSVATACDTNTAFPTSSELHAPDSSEKELHLVRTTCIYTYYVEYYTVFLKFSWSKVFTVALNLCITEIFRVFKFCD